MKVAQKFFMTEDKPRSKSNLAQISSALLAFIALAGIYFQISLTRQNALQASSRQLYLAYTQANLAYPRLAYPNYMQLKNNMDPTELNRYKIYVANMLTVYDEIINITDKPEWRAAFEYDIRDHMPYICEITDKTYFTSYWKKTRGLISIYMNKYCPKVPEIMAIAPVYPQKP